MDLKVMKHTETYLKRTECAMNLRLLLGSGSTLVSRCRSTFPHTLGCVHLSMCPCGGRHVIQIVSQI
jgi:hypothetical protein